jgi:hypothetical protein
MRRGESSKGYAKLARNSPSRLELSDGRAALKAVSICRNLARLPVDDVRGARSAGGAVATQVRVHDPWFLFPVALGMLAWLGLYLRDARVRALVPFRT